MAVNEAIGKYKLIQMKTITYTVNITFSTVKCPNRAFGLAEFKQKYTMIAAF